MKDGNYDSPIGPPAGGPDDEFAIEYTYDPISGELTARRHKIYIKSTEYTYNRTGQLSRVQVNMPNRREDATK